MISICIPTWEAYGNGTWLLTRCLNSIEKQTYRDFEIIVSDNSYGDEIYNLCKDFGRIRYIYNPKRGMAVNTNNATKNAKGIIKILYQDDWFADENSLKDIVDNFTGDWMITGCSNNPHPYWTKEVPKGKNTLGSPSCLTMRYATPLNEDLKWMLDCELYARLYNRFGWPKILDKVNVNIGLGEFQETNHISDEIKRAEENSGATPHD